MEKTSKKVSESKLKVIFVITAVILVLVFSFQVSHGDNAMFGVLLSSDTGAKVETWAEQTWKDKLIGNGIWMTRTLYTITPQKAVTTKTYENKRLLLSTSNKTSVAQTASYTYSATKGHSVSAEIKGKSSHFEAAVGYTFSYATTTSYTANVNVPAKQDVTVYAYDVVIKKQHSVYKKQPQRQSLSGWINNGTATSSVPLIKQYNGIHLAWE